LVEEITSPNYHSPKFFTPNKMRGPLVGNSNSMGYCIVSSGQQLWITKVTDSSFSNIMLVEMQKLWESKKKVLLFVERCLVCPSPHNTTSWLSLTIESRLMSYMLWT
jgi:hypothetical protein